MGTQDKTRVAVVGRGIAALAFLDSLSCDQALASKLDLFWCAAPELAPGCSAFSTALVADHGIKRGLSELGDLLVEAHETSVKWYESHSLPGVYRAQHLALDDQSEGFQRRYEGQVEDCDHFLLEHSFKARKASAYLIDAPVFLAELEKKICERLSIKCRSQMVLDYKDGKLVTDTQEVEVDRVIWANGAAPQALAQQSVHPKAKRLKRVLGYALHYTGIDWGSSCFALTVAGHNLIYRPGHVFLGGTTQPGSCYLPDANSLCEQRKAIERAGVNLANLKDKTPQFWGGPRQKGQKRQPLIAPLSDQEFGLLGYYKNGYSLAFLGAERACTWLSDTLPH